MRAVPWPSLYDPGLEILHIPHRLPTQPGGVYLDDAHDVFRFTLYWTLIFYTPATLICGTYAFFNLSFPPSPLPFETRRETHALTPLPVPENEPKYIPLRRAPNARRSRQTFIVLIFLVFLILSVAGAVLGSAVLSFSLYALYRAGHYHISTWIPFIWAVIQCLVGFLSIWPSVIDIL